MAENEEAQEESPKGIKLNLRLPIELHSALTLRAKKNRRSLNNEMLIMLERLEKSEEILIEDGQAPTPVIESLQSSAEGRIEDIGPTEDDWEGPDPHLSDAGKDKKRRSNNA